MSADDERAATVALLRTGRRPWVEYSELLEQHGGALAALEHELSDRTVGRSAQTSLLPEAAPDMNELLDQARRGPRTAGTRAGMRLVTVLDPDYPPNLRAVHDRPPMVFVAGRLTPADARGVAVVGARKATDAGTEQTATNFARASRRPADTRSSQAWRRASTPPPTPAHSPEAVAPSPSSGPASPAPTRPQNEALQRTDRERSARSSRSSGPIRRPAGAASRCATR